MTQPSLYWQVREEVFGELYKEQRKEEAKANAAMWKAALDVEGIDRFLRKLATDLNNNSLCPGCTWDRANLKVSPEGKYRKIIYIVSGCSKRNEKYNTCCGECGSKLRAAGWMFGCGDIYSIHNTDDST